MPLIAELRDDSISILMFNLPSASNVFKKGHKYVVQRMLLILGQEPPGCK